MPAVVTHTTGVLPRRPQVRPSGGLGPWPALLADDLGDPGQGPALVLHPAVRGRGGLRLALQYPQRPDRARNGRHRAPSRSGLPTRPTPVDSPVKRPAGASWTRMDVEVEGSIRIVGAEPYEKMIDSGPRPDSMDMPMQPS